MTSSETDETAPPHLKVTVALESKCSPKEKDSDLKKGLAPVTVRVPFFFKEEIEQEGPWGQDKRKPNQKFKGLNLPISQYVEERLLGKGSMGSVSLARDHLLCRNVALKKLLPRYISESEAAVRFLREAQITAQLEHPGIIPVYQVLADSSNCPMYSMKVVEEKTLYRWLKELSERLQKGKATKKDQALAPRLEMFLKICDAISYAHSKGVIHRDLKPENILIGHFGEVYVADWGISRLVNSVQENDGSLDKSAFETAETIGFLESSLSDDSFLSEEPSKAGRSSDHLVQLGLSSSQSQLLETADGDLIGTPAYMSPEQASRIQSDVGVQSDVYSLGIILYEMFYFQRAFLGENYSEILEKILEGSFPEPKTEEWSLQVPREIELILRKALTKDRSERYQSVDDLSKDLRCFLRQEETVAFPDNWLRKNTRRLSHHRERVWFALFSICLLLLSWNVVSVYNQRQLEKQARLREVWLVGRSTKTLEQSHQINSYFYKVEGLLRQFSGAAQLAMISGDTSKRPYFLNHLFSPPDLADSLFFLDKTSVRWPVIKLAPNLKEAEVLPELYRLMLLKNKLRETLLSSVDDKQLQKPALLDKILLNTGLPVVSVFLGTKKGIMLLFPGRGSYPTSYDPRLRPWFRAARHSLKLRWSRSYISSQKLRAVLIACTLPIFDSQKNFLGVAGVDLRLNQFGEILKDLKKKSGWMEEVFLLNAQGRIIVRSSKDYKRFAGRRIVNEPLSVPLFPFHQFFDSIKSKKKSGHILLKDGKQHRLITYVFLSRLNGFYVTISRLPLYF